MRRIGIWIAAGGLLLATAACGGGSGGGGGGGTTPKSESLSVGAVAEPANLDFTSTEGAAIPQALLVNVYEGLVKLDQNGQIVPLLAEKWDVSDDRKTYTFTLRKNVKFSSGAPFTADDVVFSLDRVKSDWKLKIKTQLDVVDKVEKKDDSTAVVTLKQPSNGFLYSMTSRLGAMFSRTGVADLANKPVGTGPYVLGSWRRGDSLRLDANPSYWGTEPALSSVTLKYFKDATAMNNALLTGGIDVISSVQAPESLQQFADPNRFETIEGTTNGEVVLSMNNGRPPFDDKRVRQAVRHAIDHKALLDTAWAGRGQLIGSMVPPTDPWYEDRTGDYPYDPAKAKELLGGKTYTVKLRIPNLPYAVNSAQVVKSQLAQVGITAEIEPLEFPARWLDQVFTKGDYDLSIINHVEPRDMGIFADKSYYFRYDNPEFGKLLASADAGTEQEQADDLKQAAKLLSEDAAADWLFLFPNLIVAKKGVTGLPKNAIAESFDFTALAKQ
ncbi:ABC transporter substrate-binding protein [Nonomuraea gerenzanensis]|uniref:Oligopeptide ABC transporter, periplasmic oligopeptide-binding protein OppA (TC 3.A.1.5.1) n=1 Tax=Nonomuraea gerenzanensis TaxID=93944 RepID=A0A1M4E8S6_9ACTN|nr:ABC transporter substrate-binding protein [Nonomuraea gerenzanensis]UBU17531.1 ABC transporter substrate-binding protein [Nonomuraea gerenzanensis]SBO95291.1 Oligopeptide ABC transporter, periplasmic oligopeptide-binding protein OppA (TC 3.A.1.5.1) [Nonomuraea gerenzanensis]